MEEEKKRQNQACASLGTAVLEYLILSPLKH